MRLHDMSSRKIELDKEREFFTRSIPGQVPSKVQQRYVQSKINLVDVVMRHLDQSTMIMIEMMMMMQEILI